MKAILLAAGYGIRLQPLTKTTPKCLVDINGKPLLLHWIELLINAGIESILLNTHYLTDQVEQFVFNSGYAEKITLSHEEELLGTAGTIRNNLDFIGDETFILAHADNFTICNLKGFIIAHTNKPSYTCMTMMLYNSDRPKESGIVELNEDNVVINFHEKINNPPSNLANAAVYILDGEVVKAINDRKLSDFSTEVIPIFMGQINTWNNNLYHIDIGTPEALARANENAIKLL